MYIDAFKTCEYCGSADVIKDRRNCKGKYYYQQYRCNSCKKGYVNIDHQI